MQVHDAEEFLAAVLAVRPTPDGTEVVAQVQRPGRLNSGEDARSENAQRGGLGATSSYAAENRFRMMWLKTVRIGVPSA
jgi:hypothetical protein